jgi:ubiquinone/menaquinone biosynthesis C-methylase UbiE
MSGPRGDEHHLDYDAVRAYWEDVAHEAESASYMAHEQGLPHDCVEHRFALEQAVIDRWFAGLGPTASVLDVGCGAGAWTELFARRYGRIVGVDASAHMLAAARRRLAAHEHVELVQGDALTVALEGEFQGVLVGGVLMYLDRADAVALLVRLGRLAPKGRIILRESGVRAGVEVQTDAYPVVYRCLQEYQAMAGEAGLRVVSIERNRGYAHMEVAVALVDLARRLPPLARRDPETLGRPLWRLLRTTAPVTLELLPRALAAAGLDWPHLTNHFLLLEPARQ